MIRAALMILLLLPATAQAEDDLLQHGKALAAQNCATCHAIEQAGPSALRDAPPFRDIATSYTVDELEDAFNEGVVTEHPAMPDWQMTPEQAAALSRYIMSLAPYGLKKTKLQR